MRLGPGSPEPLGVTLTQDGANVAVVSAHATAVEFCRFDPAGAKELGRVALPERTGNVFHAFVPGVLDGDRYGFRAHGPYDPRAGHRFNPAKLLVDPYVRALDRAFSFHPAQVGGGNDPASRDDTDSAPFVPKGIVTHRAALAALNRRKAPWSSTIIYELHVRGFTRMQSSIPESLRGTFGGLAHPAAIAHLTRLGVTAVELMPVGAWIEERHLARLGLSNYWGYNPIAPFVPDPRLAPGGIDEMRRAVVALRAAGIEVILDVVLNHTGEGDALGPTVSLRGLDNATYYRTHVDDHARYVDDTGCGNALALDRPPALRLALDVLRYYASATGVDGFRFDLATTLGRRADGFDPDAPLLQAIAQDPALRDLKLIAEPWDVGPGGYRLGEFPCSWAEWNDRYRDTARKYWRGNAGQIGDLATRLAGSADVFAARRRPPSRSINFVAAHDGFTLADLVSYVQKHNRANGEDNRDGSDVNHSWNHGVEGPSDDPAIVEARRRDVRNLLVTLFVSRGTPMLAMGDELGRTQQGNNNGYAQDSRLTWVDWSAVDATCVAFVARLIDLRKRYAALHQDRWLDGVVQDESGVPDVEWRRPDGEPMDGDDWSNPDARSLVVALHPRPVHLAAPQAVATTLPATDASLQASGSSNSVAIAFNASDEAISVRWPEPREGYAWHLQIDTALVTGIPGAGPPVTGDETTIAPRSLAVVAEEPHASPRRRSHGVAREVLDRLATSAGIAGDWWDVTGKRHVVQPDTKRALLAAMGLAVESTADARAHLAAMAARRESGRPDAAVVAGDRANAAMPERCFLPHDLAAGARRFGLAAHLYALKRSGDQGIGDFTTLAEIGAATARAGGSIVGINPLHMLFPEDRERASPYHPSDRRFLDPIYIDVERAAVFATSDAARALFSRNSREIAALAANVQVDYAPVWRLKREVLQACFDTFEARHARDALRSEFESFVVAGGEALERFALYDAIAALHPRVPWQAWPHGLREPHGGETRQFAQRHASRIRFALYLQWLADRQFGAAARTARESGLAFGFFRDLAVGAAPDGAEVWARPQGFARGVAVGAPPDPFSTSGQNWNLPPPNPEALTANDCAAFRELLASNMRHAGALRIDHVMGLTRLFWIPEGAAPIDGAYVSYPLTTLLGALADESQRAQCLVVGEDLGTVPEGFRERLAAADVLSYRVLWFERNGSSFAAPGRYPGKAATAVSTHDLPTIAGWWSGADIAEKAALGLLDADAETAAKLERTRDKRALAEAIDVAGVTDGAALAPYAPHDAVLTAAVHRFVGAAPSAFVLVQADDLALEATALNLPGTDRERPNWRRKVRTSVDALWRTPAARLTIAGFEKRDGPAYRVAGNPDREEQ